jgi:hypothetical protein
MVCKTFLPLSDLMLVFCTDLTKLKFVDEKFPFAVVSKTLEIMRKTEGEAKRVNLDSKQKCAL